MSKPPSEATLLRQARSELRQMTTRAQRAECMLTLEKQRADKAEAECRQWQTRFDQLLAVTKAPRNT